MVHSQGKELGLLQEGKSRPLPSPRCKNNSTSLVIFQEREEVDEIDLRKVTDLKGPDSSGTYEQQCSIQIVVPDR